MTYGDVRLSCWPQRFGKSRPRCNCSVLIPESCKEVAFGHGFHLCFCWLQNPEDAMLSNVTFSLQSRQVPGAAWRLLCRGWRALGTRTAAAARRGLPSRRGGFHGGPSSGLCRRHNRACGWGCLMGEGSLEYNILITRTHCLHAEPSLVRTAKHVIIYFLSFLTGSPSGCLGLVPTKYWLSNQMEGTDPTGHKTGPQGTSKSPLHAGAV